MSRAINDLFETMKLVLPGLFASMVALTAVSQPEATVAPPDVLIDASVVYEPDVEVVETATLTWDQVQAEIKPAPWPDVPAQPAVALPAEALKLINQSEAIARRGERFRAIEQLREAEKIAPDHPAVKRALGMAYADSGNLTRAESYLREFVSVQRTDAEALLVLARHGARSSSLERVLADCAALEQAASTKPLADLYRSEALARLGYSAAAAEQLARAIDTIQAIDLKKQADDIPGRVQRELGVVKAMLPQLRVDLGDMYLRSGDFKLAEQAYAETTIVDPSTRHPLMARRVYLALITGQREAAADLTIELLREPDTITEDAQLVAYLVQQGVSSQVLGDRLTEVLRDDGVDLPKLQAFAAVGETDAVIVQIDRWLGDGPLTPQRLAHAVSLVDFDDSEPAEAASLAALLKIISQALQQSPDNALVLSRIAIGKIDAPVTLLRAIRSEAFTTEQTSYDRLIAAVAYESVDRRADALSTYQPLLEDQRLADQVLPPVADLQLKLGMGAEALKLLGEPNLDAPWPTIELSLRALAAAGEVRKALNLVDQYIQANGKQLKPDTLRIELIAQMGQPMEACNLLLRMIRTYPADASLYELGISIAYDYRDFFNREADSVRMGQAFLSRMISNLPDATPSRIGMAMRIKSNPVRLDEATDLLLKVLDEEPNNVSALSELYEIYQSTGDEEAADAIYERYLQAIGPGVPRALFLAERAVADGRLKEAIKVLDETLMLEKQGVLPGRPMTAAQASRLLRHLEAADPQRNTDELTLRFVRQFPDDAGLNNALGYRWATQNKNLLQAKEMIERALKADPMNHSILDSLAWVQYKLGAFEEAKATQSRALMVLEVLLARLRRPGLDLPGDAQRELNATTAILNDHMGDILYKLGDTKRALEHWRVAMKQTYGEEEKRFDPELRSLDKRLTAKVDAMAKDEPVPVADVPGPESHGPEGHPAEIDPGEPVGEG